MKVKLLDYQENALDILLYTKNTRLQGEKTLQEIMDLPEEVKMDHLDYMKKTIQSSFEFCNYIFEISGVSRVFTHQLVRTRTASYAQESQRTVDVSSHEVLHPDNVSAMDATNFAVAEYGRQIRHGVEVQNARYILPMGMTTSIIMGANLRTLSQMAELRLCKRTAGEYQEVFKAMKAAVVEVHPWADSFLEVYCVKTGICCFPNYTECPVQKHCVVTDEQKPDIKHAWETIEHVANPIAKDGKSQ